MTKLWESDSFVDDNTLTVNITRLRKKLEGEGLKDFIITKKGLEITSIFRLFSQGKITEKWNRKSVRLQRHF